MKKRALLRQLVQNEEKGDSSSHAGCVARTLVSLHEAGGREGELSESSTGQEGFPKHDLRCLFVGCSLLVEGKSPTNENISAMRNPRVEWKFLEPTERER